jgi:hypothetical protein
MLLAAARCCLLILFLLAGVGREGLRSECCITSQVLMLSAILVMMSVHSWQGYVVEFAAHTACTAAMLHDC